MCGTGQDKHYSYFTSKQTEAMALMDKRKDLHQTTSQKREFCRELIPTVASEVKPGSPC